MTNREYITGLLRDEGFFDDAGASYEAMVYYNISCPYRGNDERAHCGNEDTVKRETCFRCKEEWLDMEVDA